MLLGDMKHTIKMKADVVQMSIKQAKCIDYMTLWFLLGCHVIEEAFTKIIILAWETHMSYEIYCLCLHYRIISYSNVDSIDKMIFICNTWLFCEFLWHEILH